MSEENFRVEKGVSNQPQPAQDKGERKIIDESAYKIHAPREKGPTAVGRGGDPFFRRINAKREELLELMEETQTIQDWVQRETSNNVALACLDNENLKEIYFEIKDGFISADKTYGKISLMGFKTPLGVEIPRLKIYDEDGEVLEVLTGQMAIDELNSRALAYKESANAYEEIPAESGEAVEIADYSDNPPADYLT